MAKKVFYNRRYKMPGWGQPYAVWTIVALAVLTIVFFTSVERVQNDPAPQLPVTMNGYADGLFYELREAEPGSHADVLLAYARRLEKKHGYKVREEKEAGCKIIRITHGNGPQYGIAAISEGEKTQAAFALLTFLDRILPQNPSAALDTEIILAAKNCETADVLATYRAAGLTLPLAIETGDINPGTDRLFDLKNLKLRRHFEQMFLPRERTLSANTMAIVAAGPAQNLTLQTKGAWAASPEAALLQNPLLKHPLVAKISGEEIARPAALYLAADWQLMKGGLIAVLVLSWILAVIPFANALGTFRERLDITSALTSAFLYGVAFFAYAMLLRLVLSFAKSDFSVALISLFLLPIIFIPVRILQKNVLRAELNRAGLHILIQILLTAAVFINPILAIFGFACLLVLSGFSRADVARKIIRLVLLGLVFTVFFLVARQPLGTFTQFFALLFPVFTVAGVFKLILLSFIGGNLVSLLFVPRERN